MKGNSHSSEMVQPDVIAPLFTAEAYNNEKKSIEEIDLESYRGKYVVLFFYPSDFTFVWPTELAAVAAVYQDFKALNADVLAISTDSVYSHKVFTEVSKLLTNLPFLLVSDRTHKIGTSYQVLDKATGASSRTTFIIDPEGIIAARLSNPPEVGRNIYEILRLIAGIQHNRATGEVIPANWMPGQSGIKRDSNWIGRI
jgi:NADH-dependent peroxiredoxin subunit C